MLRKLGLLGAICSAAALQAQSSVAPLPTAPPTLVSGLGSITVTSTRIADLTPDGIVITVNLSLTPTRSVTVESIRLSELSVNELPIHADPINHLQPLPKGKPTPLPQLTIKVLFRDLTTVAPLRQMVDKQVVHIHGQANATLHASFVEKLALGTTHPVVSMDFAQDVPITLPDSAYAKQAADTILTFVQAGLDAGATASGKASLFEPDWIKALRLQAPNALFKLATRYTLEQNHKSFPIVIDLLAFQVESGFLLTTPEAKAPWEYEPDFLARIQSGEARLTPQATDIQLYPVTLAASTSPSATSLQLSHGDFTLREQGSAVRTKTIVDETPITSVQVRNRASARNVLTIAPPSLPSAKWPTQGLALATEPPPTQTSWPKLAVFRLMANPPKGGQTIELIQLSAHREGDLLRLDEPLDPAAFGSPVVGPDGVLAIVQDEATAALLPQLRTAPK